MNTDTKKAVAYALLQARRLIIESGVSIEPITRRTTLSDLEKMARPHLTGLSPTLENISKRAEKEAEAAIRRWIAAAPFRTQSLNDGSLRPVDVAAVAEKASMSRPLLPQGGKVEDVARASAYRAIATVLSKRK